LGLLIGFGGAAASIFIAIMFWRKSRKAPRLVIVQIVVGVLSSAIASIACAMAFDMQLDVPVLLIGFAFQVAIGGLWIGYFMRSKRVANTFISR
jgi:threonine/homoserine efflux transporter RhtA